MTMATKPEAEPERRSSKNPMLRKQPEIEEADEEVDTSPGSDQSDATITAVDTCSQVGGGSPENGSPDNSKKGIREKMDDPGKSNHVQANPKVKQLTRSQALCEDVSPPPEHSTASTCSSDSGSSGVGSKSQIPVRGRLEKEGSQSSEAGTSSSLSRDSSVDTPYKDSTGIDLEDFIRKTLNKTPKDRNMLLKLETDLAKFIKEPKHHYLKFPQMSSYDRMLVHRVAAFFGLDHNVDQTGKCVIVNKTGNTRIPDFCFQDHIQLGDCQPKKKILKRHGASLEETESRSLEKPSLANMKAKSLEERQEIYEAARTRIFNNDEEQPTSYTQEEVHQVTGIMINNKASRPVSLGSSREDRPWSSTDSSGYGTDGSSKSRMTVPKANSFGGTPSQCHHHLRSPYKGNSLSKADSLSSGASSSLGSPMARHPPVAPSPPGPVPGPGQQVFWVASDMRSIPPGSVIINQQTGQPYVNPDGTAYRFNPTNLPPVLSGGYTQAPQPVYAPPQMSEVWPVRADSSSADQLCQQFSVIAVTPQGSSEGMGEPTTPGTSQPPAPMVLGGQSSLQPANFSQQPTPLIQGPYYPGQSVAGQPIRYVYSIPGQPGHGPPATLGVEGQGQTYTASASQYSQPCVTSYPGYPNIAYQSGTQPGTEGVSSSYQTSFPMPAQSEAGVSGYSSYPVQYSQSSFGQTQSQVYYTVPTTSTSQIGFTTFGTQGTYSATPPSQGTTNPSAPSVGVNVAQPISYGSAPPSGSAPTGPTPQFISYSTYPQFSSAQRPPNPAPQIVPFPSVQSHVQSHTQPAQTIPMFRPNMQMSMQQLSSQGGIPQGSAGQPSVSVKGYSVENQVPKIETVGDSRDIGLGQHGTLGSQMVAAPPRTAATIYRAPTPGELRFVSPTRFATPHVPQVPPLQFSQTQQQPQPQPQRQRMGGAQPGGSAKSQRSRKVRGPSKEGSQGSQHSIDSPDSVNSGPHILEVYDLQNNLTLTEAENILKELVTSGALLQYVAQDSCRGDAAGGSVSLISDFQKILAIFPDPSMAARVLKNHSSNLYRLRSTEGDSIG